MDDIKRAVITAEKVLHAKSSQLNVNAISHSDIMGLQDTMKLLMKKVENLSEENRLLKENFGKHVSDKSFPNQKTNNNPQNPKFDRPYNQFGYSYQNSKPDQRNDGCIACGNNRCSGKINQCDAKMS